MLLTNQRLDKLAAARADFEARGMLQHALDPGPLPQPNPHADDDDTTSDEEDVEGITSVGDVKLAKHPGKFD